MTMTITAPTLRRAVMKVRDPKCEDCVNFRGGVWAMVGEARLRHGRCLRVIYPIIEIAAFADDVRDDASLCEPSGKWFEAKAGAVA